MDPVRVSLNFFSLLMFIVIYAGPVGLFLFFFPFFRLLSFEDVLDSFFGGTVCVVKEGGREKETKVSMHLVEPKSAHFIDPD